MVLVLLDHDCVGIHILTRRELRLHPAGRGEVPNRYLPAQFVREGPFGRQRYVFVAIMHAILNIFRDQTERGWSHRC